MPLLLVFLNHFQVNWPKTGFFAAHQRVKLHAFEFVYMDLKSYGLRGRLLNWSRGSRSFHNKRVAVDWG